jgi:hypothetical protein
LGSGQIIVSRKGGAASFMALVFNGAIKDKGRPTIKKYFLFFKMGY